jgi:hypothetical protein
MGIVMTKYTAEEVAWKNMMQRCNNKSYRSYHRYGGRGIGVCERWNKMHNFVQDMGARPEGHSLDRIDNNGNYEPSNCKWATAKEQANNRQPAQIRKALSVRFNKSSKRYEVRLASYDKDGKYSRKFIFGSAVLKDVDSFISEWE